MSAETLVRLEEERLQRHEQDLLDSQTLPSGLIMSTKTKLRDVDSTAAFWYCVGQRELRIEQVLENACLADKAEDSTTMPQTVRHTIAGTSMTAVQSEITSAHEYEAANLSIDTEEHVSLPSTQEQKADGGPGEPSTVSSTIIGFSIPSRPTHLGKGTWSVGEEESLIAIMEAVQREDKEIFYRPDFWEICAHRLSQAMRAKAEDPYRTDRACKRMWRSNLRQKTEVEDRKYPARAKNSPRIPSHLPKLAKKRTCREVPRPDPKYDIRGFVWPTEEEREHANCVINREESKKWAAEHDWPADRYPPEWE